MNKFKRFMTVTAFSLMVLSLPAIASAQWRDRDDDDYNRNAGYNQNRGYGNYGNNDSRNVVRNLKKRTRELTRQIDRDLDRSRADGTRREDRINEVADRFKDAVNDLDNKGRLNDREVGRVHQRAQELDRAIGRTRVSNNTQNLWYAIRNDLRSLGGYGYYDNNNRNNRNNRNNYPSGNNRNRNNLPSWWPF